MDLKIDRYFAELIGIILGDGNLYDSGRHYILGISINNQDNPKYVKYVNDLMERVLKLKPKILVKKDIELPAPKGAGFLLPRPQHLNGVLYDLHKLNFP